MRKFYIQLAVLIIGLGSAQAAFADVKVKIRQTMSGQTYENTTYIKGKRERSEQNLGNMERVNITQCDLKRSIQILPSAKTYMIDPWEQVESVEPSQTVTKTQVPGQAKTGGIINMTTTIKDTGERKQMFGYTARHLIITMESESSPDACTPMKSKMQWDGWYIDATFALDCQTERYAGYQSKVDKNGCRDKYVSKQVGAGKRGYPLYEKLTMFDESGKETYSYVNEVIELSNATLDAALFEVPAGYNEVKTSAELYASMANQRKNSTDDDDDNSNVRPSSGKISSNMNAPVSNGNSVPSQNSAPVEVGAKKEGVIRIGLANVKVGAVSENMNPQALAQVIQNTFGEYIKTPQVELISLEAKVQSAIDAEAKSKQCDFVLYANASYKKGGGGGMFGKMIGNVASSAIGHVGGYGSTGAAVATSVAQTVVYTAASMASNVKSKDEITLEIKLQTPDSANALLAKQFKVKAKSDGDDIITTVIEQTSQAVVDAVKK